MPPGRPVLDRASCAVTACWTIVVTVFMCGGGIFLFASTVGPFMGRSVIPTTERPGLPTETIAPTKVKVAKPALVIARIIEERVNVRAAPTMDAEVVGGLEKGAQITLVGKSQDGKWYRIQSDDEIRRWIFGETLEITDGDPGILPRDPATP